MSRTITVGKPRWLGSWQAREQHWFVVVRRGHRQRAGCPVVKRYDRLRPGIERGVEILGWALGQMRRH